MLTRETISLMSLISLLVLLLASSVQANTEKTIFVAPASITIPNVHPGLDDLCIDDISPAQSVLRTRLPAAFPTKASPQGNQSWYILDQLRAGQRYEVRVCWVATVSTPLPWGTAFDCMSAHGQQQPTEFWLDTFPITHVFETPSLIAGLAEYAENRGESACQRNSPIDPSVAGTQTSALFLRLRSAADFYTTNKTLMSNPPLVGVDISEYIYFPIQ